MIEGVTLNNIVIGLLAYANDLALMKNNLETVRQHSRKLISVAEKCGFKINDKKPEYLTTKQNQQGFSRKGAP